jgi:hypothetical protein
MNNVEVTAAVVDALNAEQIDYMLVVNVMAVSGPGMDWDYLNSWTQKHGTHSLLQDLTKEAAIVPNS